MGETGFYESVPSLKRFVELAEPSLYRDVPRDWSIVVTDIVSSTAAVESGRYKDVNVLGAASIVAVVNAIGRRDVPYVFGGDGATILLGPDDVAKASVALAALSREARELFGLELRVGCVPIADLMDAGHTVQVAKLELSRAKNLAMLWGSGIQAAERLVKDPATAERYAIRADEGNRHPELRGLSCRWEPLGSRHGHMLTVIAVATAGEAAKAAGTYRRLVEFLEETMPMSAPITAATARMGNDRRAFATEATLRTHARSGLRHWLVRQWIAFESFIARQLLRRGKKLGGFDGKLYLQTLVSHTDFRKFDGAVRAVLDVTTEQSDRIRDYLALMHQSGDLVYGTHMSHDALMTCVVGDFEADHIHFIDGADGGYAFAAKQLKQQIVDRTAVPA